jgi:MFS transporter, SP family, sugar:H+ symporter
MTIFVYIFLLETKGVSIEEMIFLWRKQWLWKRIMSEVAGGVLESNERQGNSWN